MLPFLFLAAGWPLSQRRCLALELLGFDSGVGRVETVASRGCLGEELLKKS